MLKGKTKIILTNVETGEQEVHEDTNLVTDAIDKIINISLCCNQTPGAKILPIAQQVLGGLMMFDAELTESADNIHFPTSEAHLVGYAGRDANTSDPMRGSLNISETGRTGTGFVSTWDFGTSQANGTIGSIALTSAHAGQNPLRYYMMGQENLRTLNGAPDTDKTWAPIRYDGEFVYMLKGDTTTHKMRLARVRVPLFAVGVADSFSMEKTYEVLAEWDTELFTYSYSYPGGSSGTTTVYADDPKFYEDGRDGYIYCMANQVSSLRHADYTYDVSYFTIKYDDESYTKSETYKLNTGTSGSGESTTQYHVVMPVRQYGHVNNGKYYRLGENRKTITIIPLDLPASSQTVTIIDSSSSDYISSLHLSSPNDGGVYYSVYHYLSSGYEYRSGILYADGEYLTQTVASDSAQSNPYTRTWYISDDLVGLVWTDNITISYMSTSFWIDWAANYLGTINNLSTPITKTAAQTMKIIYTLTDVDEEPAVE